MLTLTCLKIYTLYNTISRYIARLRVMPNQFSFLNAYHASYKLINDMMTGQNTTVILSFSLGIMTNKME